MVSDGGQWINTGVSRTYPGATPAVLLITYSVWCDLHRHSWILPPPPAYKDNTSKASEENDPTELVTTMWTTAVCRWSTGLGSVTASSWGNGCAHVQPHAQPTHWGWATVDRCHSTLADYNWIMLCQCYSNLLNTTVMTWLTISPDIGNESRR